MTGTTSLPIEPPTSEKPTSRDFRQEVTDNIVRMLEHGVAPWQKPWEPGAGSLDMPLNPTSERAYRGGNAIHLMATGLQRGYEDPRWMTYKQAADNGWQVRRGEKGTQIEFWDVKQTSDKGPPSGPRGNGDVSNGYNIESERPRFIHRVYTVFNAEQIDYIPAHVPKEYTRFEAVQAGEQILDNSGANIAHDQADRAFYSRAQDSIHLPPKHAFKDAAGYYGTALHELAHWSGHPSRLSRPTLTDSYRFGDTNYAKEELRAELASVFLAAQRGIPHNPEQHAAYVNSWIGALKRDKNEIFRAAHDASKAADFILAMERDKSISEQELASGPTLADGSPAAVLEQEAERLHHDREQVEEKEVDTSLSTEDLAIEASVGDANERSTPARESSEYATRFEPGGGTVNVQEKQTGTDRRSTVDRTIGDSLADAKSIATNALGDSARTIVAETQSGNYKGPIIGETDHHIVQRQSGRTAIAHSKELLDRQPQVGESVRINYSDSKGSVRELRERSKSQGLDF